MALDPKVKALLEKVEAVGAPPLYELTPKEAREAFNLRHLSGKAEKVGKVENKIVPGIEVDIPIRIYKPNGEGPFPVLVYYHGGGWVVGGLDDVDVPCCLLTNQANCVVVSVDYRLAPEHKFPAAIEDAYTALIWVVENAPSINVDPTRVVVGGDSAGGNLAAVVSLMCKEKKGPSLLYQLLVYPVTNHAFETISYEENGEGYMLMKKTMMWFWNHYLRSEEDGRNPYASPLLAEDLSGLPPALIITAEYDPLRDEGEAYAKRLEEAGVPVELKRFNGMIHGFFWMSGAIDQAKVAIDLAASKLEEIFQKH